MTLFCVPFRKVDDAARDKVYGEPTQVKSIKLAMQNNRTPSLWRTHPSQLHQVGNAKQPHTTCAWRSYSFCQLISNPLQRKFVVFCHHKVCGPARVDYAELSSQRRTFSVRRLDLRRLRCGTIQAESASCSPYALDGHQATFGKPANVGKMQGPSHAHK
jgi:hypothetical protein